MIRVKRELHEKVVSEHSHVLGLEMLIYTLIGMQSMPRNTADIPSYTFMLTLKSAEFLKLY